MAEGGLAAVFLANRPLVRRLVAARAGDPVEADDVLQELWLRIETTRVGPVGDPLAYVMRMALNLANDRHLAERRRTAREHAWSGVQSGAQEQPDAERRLVSAEELARLQALIGSMPERMHRALVLFRIEGKSQRAIADELGITVSGVEKLLARAYRQLVEFRNDTLADSGGAETAGNEGGDGRSKNNG
jgi:RNA polymerase sigma-70 factor (ECF subfamily)